MLSLYVDNYCTDIPSQLQKNQERRQENKRTESQPKCPRKTVFEYKIKHCSWANLSAGSGRKESSGPGCLPLSKDDSYWRCQAWRLSTSQQGHTVRMPKQAGWEFPPNEASAQAVNAGICVHLERLSASFTFFLHSITQG